MTLGMVLAATKGFAAPEVAHAYTRAHALCREVGDPPQLISVLSGLYGFHVVRAEFQTAQELAEQYLTLAHTLQDPTRLGMAHRWLGQSTFWRGELKQPTRLAAEHNPLTRAAPRPGFEHRGRPWGHGSILARLDTVAAGLSAQARQRSHEALTLAQGVVASLHSGCCSYLVCLAPSLPLRKARSPRAG